MYSLTKGKVASLAPKRVKTSSIVKSPIIDIIITDKTDRMIPSVAVLFISFSSFLPTALDNTEAEPILMPDEIDPTIITMGKVKPIAANDSVPNLETKYVSVRLNIVKASIPPIVGNTSLTKCFFILPVVKSKSFLLTFN